MPGPFGLEPADHGLGARPPAAPDAVAAARGWCARARCRAAWPAGPSARTVRSVPCGRASPRCRSRRRPARAGCPRTRRTGLVSTGGSNWTEVILGIISEEEFGEHFYWRPEPEYSTGPVIYLVGHDLKIANVSGDIRPLGAVAEVWNPAGPGRTLACRLLPRLPVHSRSANCPVIRARRQADRRWRPGC